MVDQSTHRLVWILCAHQIERKDMNRSSRHGRMCGSRCTRLVSHVLNSMYVSQPQNLVDPAPLRNDQGREVRPSFLFLLMTALLLLSQQKRERETCRVYSCSICNTCTSSTRLRKPRVHEPVPNAKLPDYLYCDTMYYVCSVMVMFLNSDRGAGAYVSLLEHHQNPFLLLGWKGGGENTFLSDQAVPVGRKTTYQDYYVRLGSKRAACCLSIVSGGLCNGR